MPVQCGRQHCRPMSFFEARQASLYSTTVDLRSLEIALTVDLCLVVFAAEPRILRVKARLCNRVKFLEIESLQRGY